MPNSVAVKPSSLFMVSAANADIGAVEIIDDVGEGEQRNDPPGNLLEYRFLLRIHRVASPCCAAAVVRCFRPAVAPFTRAARPSESMRVCPLGAGFERGRAVPYKREGRAVHRRPPAPARGSSELAGVSYARMGVP